LTWNWKKGCDGVVVAFELELESRLGMEIVKKARTVLWSVGVMHMLCSWW